MHIQMMKIYQESTVDVAYEADGKDIKMEYNGVYVMSVQENTPAAGKLKMGDRITEIDNQEISEADDLIDIVDQKQVGDTIMLQVMRDDEPRSETITLAELDGRSEERREGT